MVIIILCHMFSNLKGQASFLTTFGFLIVFLFLPFSPPYILTFKFVMIEKYLGGVLIELLLINFIHEVIFLYIESNIQYSFNILHIFIYLNFSYMLMFLDNFLLLFWIKCFLHYISPDCVWALTVLVRISRMILNIV